MITVKDITYLGEYKLEVTFSNGEVFEPLRKKNILRQYI